MHMPIVGFPNMNDHTVTVRSIFEYGFTVPVMVKYIWS